MKQKSAPGLGWLLTSWAVALLVGGVAYAITKDHSPVRAFRTPVVTETSIHTVIVLPEGQAEVTGTVTAFAADDANGPPIAMPIELPSGGATIDGATVDGRRSTIVWDGGRPFRMSGSGTIDLGPTHVELGVGALFWPLDGVRVLTPGTYRIDTPVAVGSAGLAQPRDSVTFTADDNTSIETRVAAPVVRGLPVHLEGPGRFHADGTFSIRTREGTATAHHLEFGPGPFLVDVAKGGAFTATFNGPLTSK